MKKLFLLIFVLGLLFSGNGYAAKNMEKAIENCATINYLEDGSYYYYQNDWVINKNQKYLKDTKKMVDLLPDEIPENKYYKKKDNIHSLSFDEKVKFLHVNWVQIKNYSKVGYFILNMSTYMNERSDLLEEAIPKLSLKDKSKLIEFIEFYETCEYNSIKLPKTFELKFGNQ